MKWLLNVTVNDISVIYVMAHSGAGGMKKLDLRLDFHYIAICINVVQFCFKIHIT